MSEKHSIAENLSDSLDCPMEFREDRNETNQAADRLKMRRSSRTGINARESG